MRKIVALLSFLVPSAWLSTEYVSKRLYYFRAQPSDCKHEWLVISSILETSELQVQCSRCLIYSEVPAPTEKEWDDSFFAPEKPYAWKDLPRIRYYSLSAKEREELHSQIWI